jgi:hypothetical protein
MNTTTLTPMQQVQNEVKACIRARYSVIWVVTTEEERAEKYIYEANAAVNYETLFWDTADGVTNFAGQPVPEYDGADDPELLFGLIKGRSGRRTAWVLRSLPYWISPPLGITALRKLQNLIRFLRLQGKDDAQCLIVISPSREVPIEIRNRTAVIEWPLPDRTELDVLLAASVDGLKPPDNADLTDPTWQRLQGIWEQVREDLQNGRREAVLDAAVGLTADEAQACFSKSLTQTRLIDPARVAAEKKQVIARDGLLEWIDPPEGDLDSLLGGQDVWKGWLKSRKVAFSPAARAYGLETPKGALLVGVPGCGKSWSVKALGAEWKVPIIKLDLNAMTSKFVGESEGNLRQGLATIEAIGPCIVWLDELEKALAGATGEAGDGGVSADALGTILSWMQDRQGDAFVIATANNAEKLPPELMRKGRFDEVWWVDLPVKHERVEVLRSAIRSHGRDADALNLDLELIAKATDTFTGAELAALIPDAMFIAFGDGAREITTEDLMFVAGKVVPLAKTAEQKINDLRKTWAGRARSVTSGNTDLAIASVAARSPALDL